MHIYENFHLRRQSGQNEVNAVKFEATNEELNTRRSNFCRVFCPVFSALVSEDGELFTRSCCEYCNMHARSCLRRSKNPLFTRIFQSLNTWKLRIVSALDASKNRERPSPRVPKCRYLAVSFALKIRKAVNRLHFTRPILPFNSGF